MEDSGQRGPISERLLVLGVDGVVGANLALTLADRFRVLGLCRARAIALEGCEMVPWAVSDGAALEALVRRHRPRWIICCGPLASSSWDVPQPPFDAQQEAATVWGLAGLAAGLGSHLTVISTDAVFAGPRMFHGEGHPAGSLRPFAQAARHVEQALRPDDALMVRTHAYGWSPPGVEPGFAEQAWRSLVEGSACPLDPHRHATPILAADLAELLLVAYQRRLRGLYHVAGTERTSAYHFANELAAAFGLQHHLDRAADEPLRPLDWGHLDETSLDTRRARRALDRAMPMLREGLDRFAEQAANGFRARLQRPPPSAMLRGDAA